MGCGESKLAVSVADTITKSKSSKPKRKEATTTATPSHDDGAAPETSNGVENATKGEKKDDRNGEIVKDAQQAPEGNNDNVKEIVPENKELPSRDKPEDEKTTASTVVVEGEKYAGTTKEELPYQDAPGDEKTTTGTVVVEGKKDAGTTKEELPSQDAPGDEKTTKSTVVVEGGKDAGTTKEESKEETKEKKVDNQETIAEKTSINADNDVEKTKEESTEDIKEKNVDNQETITEKTSSNVDAKKNDSTEEIKEVAINQISEGNKQGPEAASTIEAQTSATPKEENISKPEKIVAEEGKEDSKAN